MSILFICDFTEPCVRNKKSTTFAQALGRTGCPTPWADADGFLDYLKASLPVGAARPIEDIRAGGLAKGCQAKTIETGPALVCSLCSEHPGWINFIGLRKLGCCRAAVEPKTIPANDFDNPVYSNAMTSNG